jgi:radical SAM protein with 4Fe4S-binding SPASM domain
LRQQRGLPVMAVKDDAPSARTSIQSATEEWVRTPSGSASATVVPPATTIPHVVAWNLTRRCNLACAHCYISAGSWQSAEGELSTPECHRVLDEVLEVSPAPMLILSGGEPLLRPDLEEIAAHAADAGATTVIGTNGTRLTSGRIASLMEAGVRGVAVSIDSLDPTYHDRFRHGQGALADTLAAVERLRDARLDFVVQATLTSGNRAELRRLVEWSAAAGAVSFNLYFLVATGRGERMGGLAPAENDDVLRDLALLQREFRGVMLIRSKCQPQIMRHVFETDPESPLLNYGTRCPCGVQYCRITPDGKVTPCPYIPAVAGDLRADSFADIWRDSPVFQRIREGELGGKCGRCEYRKICGGCRARAYADGGDLLGPDESCAYEPSGEAEVVQPREMVYGSPAQPRLAWSDDARERMERIPSFVRGVVTARVEDFAQERGYDRITAEVLAEVRASMPVDFSKRRPFFMGGEDA